MLINTGGKKKLQRGRRFEGECHFLKYPLNAGGSHHQSPGIAKLPRKERTRMRTQDPISSIVSWFCRTAHTRTTWDPKHCGGNQRSSATPGSPEHKSEQCFWLAWSFQRPKRGGVSRGFVCSQPDTAFQTEPKWAQQSFSFLWSYLPTMQSISSSLGILKTQPNISFIQRDVILNCNTISCYTIQQHTLYTVYTYIHTSPSEAC